MSTDEIWGLIIFAGVFLSGMIPLIMLLVYFIRDNRRMDEEERQKAAKRASGHGY